MTYHELNSLRKLVCEGRGTEKNNNKVFTDFHIDKTYFLDSITQKRKQTDAIQWLRDRYLSDIELKGKISEQLKLEKESKMQCVDVISWEKLLKTKLFNNTKI